MTASSHPSDSVVASDRRGMRREGLDSRVAQRSHRSSRDRLGSSITGEPGSPGRPASCEPARRRTSAPSPRAETAVIEARYESGASRAPLDGAEVLWLVRSAAAGDQDGWDALVREFGGLVSRIARAHRLDDADAADVAQTTWTRLLEHLEDLNDPARVGAWLATTARRECLRVLRHRQRLVFFGEDGPEHEASDVPPGDRLLTVERDRALWRSFARLRPSDQMLLRLMMAEPRPAYEEISLALDVPIGSIGPTRARALARLRNELDSEGTLALMTD